MVIYSASPKNPFPSGSQESKQWTINFRMFPERLGALGVPFDVVDISESVSDFEYPGIAGTRITEFKQRTGVEVKPPSGAVFKPSEVKVKYFFDQIRFGMKDASVDALNRLGESLKKSVKSSMQQQHGGKYRPYRSKRFSSLAAEGKIASRRLKHIIGEKDIESAFGLRASSMWGEEHISKAWTRKEISKGKMWTKSELKERYQYHERGLIYSTGTIKNRKGEVIGSRIGKVKQGGQGIIHWSSFPGRPPNPDTETLKRSIRYEVVKVEGGMSKLRLIADTPYAKTMELGSAARNIAPRPYLRRAIEKSKYKKEVFYLLQQAWYKNKDTIVSENLYREMMQK